MSHPIRYGFDVRRHRLKGVYVYKTRKNRKYEIACTLHEGQHPYDCESDGDADGKGSEHGPITFTYRGVCTTLRPWAPQSCIIAAAIHNYLIYFPIGPGRRVFTLDCTLRTLSHIADIVGPTGRVIGVVNRDNPKRPSAEEIKRFTSRHKRATVITEDIQNATLEGYKRLLGLPESSKYAFLMGLHPRLGEHSPVRKLAEAQAPAKLARQIFGYLDCGDASDMSCMVVCHWELGAKVDDVREVVLSHIDILRRLRMPRSNLQRDGSSAACPSDENGGGKEGASSGSGGDKEAASSAPNGDKEGEASSSHRSSSTKQVRGSSGTSSTGVAPRWVLLDLQTDSTTTGSSSTEVTSSTLGVADGMKRLTNGLQTGLFVKEQFILLPHFPNHTLLVLKYSSHRDKRTRKVARLPLGLGDDTQETDGGGNGNGSASGGEAETIGRRRHIRMGHRPPDTSIIPVPAFGSSARLAPPPLAAPPAPLQAIEDAPKDSAAVLPLPQPAGADEDASGARDSAAFPATAGATAATPKNRGANARKPALVDHQRVRSDGGGVAIANGTAPNGDASAGAIRAFAAAVGDEEYSTKADASLELFGNNAITAAPPPGLEQPCETAIAGLGPPVSDLVTRSLPCRYSEGGGKLWPCISPGPPPGITHASLLAKGKGVAKGKPPFGGWDYEGRCGGSLSIGPPVSATTSRDHQPGALPPGLWGGGAGFGASEGAYPETALQHGQMQLSQQWSMQGWQGGVGGPQGRLGKGTLAHMGAARKGVKGRGKGAMLWAAGSGQPQDPQQLHFVGYQDQQAQQQQQQLGLPQPEFLGQQQHPQQQGTPGGQSGQAARYTVDQMQYLTVTL